MLAEGAHAARRHEASLEAGTLPPGVYLLRLETAQGAETRPVVVARRVAAEKKSQRSM